MQLTIGVTGHRDLVAEEIPELKAIVRDFFVYLANEYSSLELQLITPLAEGSDSLVAEVALELGIALIVPLPMSQAHYEEDFTNTAALGFFRDALSQAKVIHLRTLPDAGEHSDTDLDRAQQYAQVGVFTSNHSQILLSLWDGKPSNATGGTAGVVNYHLTAVMPGFSVAEESPNLLADNENDLAYHVVCSRDRPDGQPLEGLKPLETSWLTAHYGFEHGDHMPLDYQVMLHRLEDFDTDEEHHKDVIEEQGANLLAEAPALHLPAGLDVINRLFRSADWLAIHFQKRVSNSLFAVHSLAVLAGLVFMMYSEYNELNYLVFLFLFAFIAGFAIYKVGERRQWHRKYLDYRALAEGLRVQVYWNLAGVIDVQSAEFAYDNFLQKQDVDLGWIRHVMRSASLARGRDQVPPDAWLDWVIEQWVGDEQEQSGQLSYYQRKAAEKVNRYGYTTLLGNISLWTGILIALLLALAGSGLTGDQRHIMLILMGILPLMAGIREAYSHKKAEKELIKQYRFMHGIFANAKRLLDSSDDVDFRRRVLRALGDAALEEDAEWILMHRERPLEHGGI